MAAGAPRRILVTGASGFVGGHLMPALRRAFPESLLVACSTEGSIPDADVVVPLDLLQRSSIEDCVAAAEPDALVHLAADSIVSSSFTDPERTWRTNVDGTLALAAAVMRSASGAVFLFASSAEAYGLSFQSGAALDEAAPFAPANPYAASKAAADIALGEMGLRGLRVLRLRPFNHTGPGQSDAFVVAAFARQIARIEAGLQEPVIRVGALERWRDFLDVRDVCAAYVAALARGADIAPGTAINIASGVPRKIGDILGGMIERSGLGIEIHAEAARMRPTDVITAAGNAGRAAELLGWRPAVAWEDTVDSVRDYWRAKVRQTGFR
jgi:GDP-4-dehydro-6-deoxy-D-mannose reductase